MSDNEDSFDENVQRPRFSYTPPKVSVFQERPNASINLPHIVWSSLFAIIIELCISFLFAELLSTFEIQRFSTLHATTAISCFVINGTLSNIPDRNLYHYATIFLIFAICTGITTISVYGMYDVFSNDDNSLKYFGIICAYTTVVLCGISRSLIFVAYYCYLLKCIPLTQCYGKYLSFYIAIVEPCEFGKEKTRTLINFNSMYIIVYILLLIVFFLYFFTYRIIRIPAFDQIDIQPNEYFVGKAKEDVLFFVRDLIKREYCANDDDVEVPEPNEQVVERKWRFQTYISSSPQLESYIAIFFKSFTGLNFICQSFITIYLNQFTLQFALMGELSESLDSNISNFEIPESQLYHYFTFICELLILGTIFPMGFYFDYLKCKFDSKVKARFVIQLQAFFLSLLALIQYSTISFNREFVRITTTLLSIFASGLQYTSLYIYLAAEFPRSKRIAICVVNGVFNLVELIFDVDWLQRMMGKIWFQFSALAIGISNVVLTARNLLNE